MKGLGPPVGGSLLVLAGFLSAAPAGEFRFQHHFIDRDLPGDSWAQTAIVDVDRDGRLDYITGRSRGEILWYQQEAFDQWTRHRLGDNSPSDVGGAALDVDGDGWVDFVAGGAWYRNTGQPRTEPFERIVFDKDLAAVHDLVIADVDGDGRPDILTMSDQNNLRWYRIPRDPRQPWERHDIGPAVHAGIGVGDLDGDGDLDVVRSNVWFENADGKGTRWVPHENIPFGNPKPPFPLATHCVVLDLDRDGDNDLVMTENEIKGGRIAWIENADGKGGAWKLHPLPASDPAPRGAYHSLIVADFDNDGDPDVFTCEMEGIPGDKPPRWFIWENVDGKGQQFVEHVVLDANLGGHLAVAADMDGDGDLDIIGKLWRPRKDNANGGRNHVDLLENLTISKPVPSGGGAGRDAAQRLRLIVETDAGGDPDDEQSLVRFLVYANEFDVEGIIANRPRARDGENQNPERTGLGIVRRLVNAYGQCWTNLVQHDARYPRPDQLLARTVAGYDDTEDGVQLVLRAVDAPDPRPVWFLNWGTDSGAAESCLKRALDRVRRERGQDGYARLKQRLRLSSADRFGEHTTKLEPPFPLWVDTLRPELDGKRWYHRFSALTATAGGFDLERDARTGHGPLSALYPTNTGLRQKEGDTMMFLYLVPTGLNDPEHPTWGSWAGRYGPNETYPGRHYFWANQVDAWRGATNRDNTLARWAVDLQNDFRARLDWCVKPFAGANHPPVVRVRGELRRVAKAGEVVTLDASDSTDLDGDRLRFEWFIYTEAGAWREPVELKNAEAAIAEVVMPPLAAGADLHVVVAVRDSGDPPLARYARVILSAAP